jgi:hypothetical protein
MSRIPSAGGAIVISPARSVAECRECGEIISSPGGTIDSLASGLPNQAAKTNLVKISSLTVFCTSVQPKSARVRASVIGAMHEQIASPASRRGVGGRRWLECESLPVLSPEGLPPFCREACLAPSLASHASQISPFLIDIWRLEIPVTLGKQRTATCSNRHVCGTLGKCNCSPQNSRRGGTLAAVWGRRGGRWTFSRRGMR